MTKRKPGKRKYLPFVSAVVFVTGIAAALIFLLAQFALEQWQERQTYLLSARMPSQEITTELCTSMSRFAGFEELWTVMESEVTLTVGDWQISTTLMGVDLETFPFTLVRSAGEKKLGSAPLLLAGEEIFNTMTDANGTAITTRQSKILTESMESLTAQIVLEASNLASSSGSAGNSDGSGYTSADTAEFLGLVSGDGLYMDAAQMRTWLAGHGSSASVHLVWLQIKGKGNAETAEKSLTDAGFQVGMEPVPVPSNKELKICEAKSCCPKKNINCRFVQKTLTKELKNI
ncbi:MAG: hypothetical protein LUD12_12510 [Lachnospiraceae bacterium]|nr:hypothetical protein [Lachnospiraceae bacterium]